MRIHTHTHTVAQAHTLARGWSVGKIKFQNKNEINTRKKMFRICSFSGYMPCNYYEWVSECLSAQLKITTWTRDNTKQQQQQQKTIGNRVGFQFRNFPFRVNWFEIVHQICIHKITHCKYTRKQNERKKDSLILSFGSFLKSIRAPTHKCVNESNVYEVNDTNVYAYCISTSMYIININETARVAEQAGRQQQLSECESKSRTKRSKIIIMIITTII